MAKDFDVFLETDRRQAALAFVKGDAAQVVALSAQSGQATFFDPSGGFTEGADAINTANTKGAHHFGAASTTELDIRDHASSSELAFWTGYQGANVDVGGKMQPMKLRITEVFRRTDGAWKLIHRHASPAKDT